MRVFHLPVMYICSEIQNKDQHSVRYMKVYKQRS